MVFWDVVEHWYCGMLYIIIGILGCGLTIGIVGCGSPLVLWDADVVEH